MSTTPVSRLRLGIALCLLGLLLPGAPALALSGWTTAGPDGGRVTALVADPSNSSRVFGATHSGSFLRSDDGGVSWSALGSVPQNRWLSVLVISPAAPSTIYGIGTSDLGAASLVQSGDGGLHWRELPFVGMDKAPISLAVDPSAASTLYAGTLTGGVFKSTNGGQSWSAVNSGMARQNVPVLVMDPSQPNTIFAGTAPGTISISGLFKSTDGAQSWHPTSLAREWVISLAIDPTNTSTMYCGTNGSGLYKSVDGGQNWVLISVPPGGGYVYLLAVDANNPSTLYAQTLDGLFRSTDQGISWTPLTVGPPPGQSLIAEAVVVVGSPSVLLASSRDAVLRSTDGGATWSTAHSGLQAATIQALALDPSSPGSVIAGGNGGVFRSTTGGEEWSAPDPATPSVSALVVDPAQPSIVYGGGSGVWKSTDGGASWTSTGTNPETRSLTSLAVDPAGTAVYAASADIYSYPSRGGLFKSTDGGQTWQSTNLSQARAIYTLLIDSIQPQTIYAGSDSTEYSYPEYPSGGGVLKTTDSGQTWSISNDLGSAVLALAGAPGLPSRLYAGTRSTGVYKSTDGGGTWTFAGRGIPSNVPVMALIADPASSSTVYAGTSQGVFRSTDGGSNWEAFRAGLGDIGVNALAVDASRKLLHAATAGGGVFERSIDSTPGSCEPGADHLCLLANRFRVDLTATDPRSGASARGQANLQEDRFGYFSLPQLTGDPTLPEVLVKMIDATSLPGNGFWVFYSGLTDLRYWLTFTDTRTGDSRDYESDGLCGAADTSAFPANGAASVKDWAKTKRAAVLAASGSELLLLNRFHLTLSATDPRTGLTSVGTAIAQDGRFGYFSLPAFTGDANFPEVFAKMIDATSLPGNGFWLFHTGLTDLEYTLEVTDAVTHTVKEYRNDPADPTKLCGEADTAAFRGP